MADNYFNNVNYKDLAIITRRRPVWVAISDLCLDTEITDDTIAYIARTVREQGFSKEEAEHIAFHEVFPVVFINLLSVAGEWAGFQEEWLVQEIVKKAQKRPSFIRSWWRQRGYRRVLQKDWDRVLTALSAEVWKTGSFQ